MCDIHLTGDELGQQQVAGAAEGGVFSSQSLNLQANAVDVIPSNSARIDVAGTINLIRSRECPTS